MKKLRNILGIILMILIISCEQYESDNNLMNYETVALEDSKLESKEETNTERKLIKEGQVEFETENLKEARNRVLQAIEKFNGYASSDKEYKNSYEISNTITIRIPAENFDNLLTEITKGVKRFDRKEISIKDVTEEFLDIEARLKTKKELENRYLEILKKANTVTEILEVERQIGELRSDIESTEGRMKFLENKVSFSTLNVRIYETITKQIEFRNKFKNGFKNGWDNLILFFVYLVNIWPFIIIIIGTIVLIKVMRKMRNK